MMAKMFYNLDEAKAALGKNEEEIKQLTREGRLREFRDGQKLMYKGDQVEALKTELAGGAAGSGHIDLGPSDSGSPIGLADTKGGSGSGLTLNDPEAGRSPGGGMTLKEDTALAADLGLSGSVGGVPSPGRASGSGISITGSKSGVDVFHSGEVERTDPSAQTAISSGVPEQMNLEGVGSGSGLLDLTRESDDTSLGAELLDEVTSGGRRSPGDTSSGSASMSGLAEPRGGVSRGGGVTFVETPDPMAAAFGAAALGAFGVVVFGIFALVAGILEIQPEALRKLGEPEHQNTFALVAGGGILVVMIFFIIGLIVGKAGNKGR